MKDKFTKEQLSAVDTNGNILVSAAAGSGKTAVLVERVIRLLTDENNPISADRLLIVTFTNAAAAEMKSRIEKRLYEVSALKPNDKALMRSRRMIASADICTIDTFCIRLVRENFDKCGVEPDFKISDGSELKASCDFVMNEIVESKLRECPECFNKLLEILGCEYDEGNFKETAEEIYLYSRQLPFPDKFLDNLCKPYSEPFNKEHIWYKQAFRYAADMIENAKNILVQMADAALLIDKNGEKCVDYANTLSFVLNSLENAANKGDWDNFYDTVCSSSLARLPSTSPDDVNALLFKGKKEELSKLIDKLLTLFYADEKTVARKISELCGPVKLLVDCIKEYASGVLSVFKKENMLTFYHTEQLALSLLCNASEDGISYTPAAKAIIEKYDEVLVDEFQDVNDLQNLLFHILSDFDRHLFVVGDVKQSIYGFRGSNPQNFINKRDTYIGIDDADDNQPKKIILSDNFRSREGICSFVNYFFSLVMAGQVGNLVYGKEDFLKASAQFPENNSDFAELLMVCKEENSNTSLLENEAECIARYILNTVNKEPFLKDGNGGLRKAGYSDIVILLDKIRDKADVLAQVFGKSGIPVSFTAQRYLETTEISLALAFLQVIDNPLCDVELLAVMMSPVYAFTAEEMAKMRILCRDKPLFSAVLAAGENGDLHAKSFIEDLNGLRRDAAVLPVDRFISKMLIKTDLINICTAMSGGDARRANLLSLSSYATKFINSGRFGIGGFLKYIKNLPEGSLKSSSGGDNAVKIMTMHTSKGLQFPICILANLVSLINNSDSTSRVLYNDEYGLALKFFDEETGLDTELAGHRFIAEKARINTVSERMRLLYVAMTRAEEKLVMVCSLKNASKTLTRISSSITPCGQRITPQFLNTARSMQDWILAASLLHPDSSDLRKLSDISVSPENTQSRLCVKIVTEENEDKTLALAEDETVADSFLAKEIARNLDFTYPYDKLKGIQAKSTVSDIANKAEAQKFAYTAKPSFMQKDGISASGRGTAMHKIMQFIDMSVLPDVDAEIERLTEWKYIDERQAAAADRAALKAFFESELYKRISASKDVRREMRFLTEIKAKRLDETLNGEIAETPVIVQGAVDLCFEENGKIIVVDFKTDRVDNEKELAQAYGEQLEIYSKACEKIFEKIVAQRIIYSFALGKEIVLE